MNALSPSSSSTTSTFAMGSSAGGHRDPEQGTPLRVVRGRDDTAVERHDAARHREAEPRASDAAGLERLEDPLLVAGRDAGPPVAHLEHEPARLDGAGGRDALAVGGGLERVLEEVLEDLAEPSDAGQMAQRILDSLSRPVLVEGREILVTATRDGASLVLAVVDRAEGARRAVVEAGSGIALATLESRLAKRYGEHAKLRLDRTDDGARAEVRLPIDAAITGPREGRSAA